MESKITFTPQDAFIEFIDSFGYNDPKLEELKDKLKANESYTNSYSDPQAVREDHIRVLRERSESHRKIYSEIMEILRDKNPILFFQKYGKYLDSRTKDANHLK